MMSFSDAELVTSLHRVHTELILLVAALLLKRGFSINFLYYSKVSPKYDNIGWPTLCPPSKCQKHCFRKSFRQTPYPLHASLNWSHGRAVSRTVHETCTIFSSMPLCPLFPLLHHVLSPRDATMLQNEHRHTSFYCTCFIVLHRYCIFFFYKLKVCGNPWASLLAPFFQQTQIMVSIFLGIKYF